MYLCNNWYTFYDVLPATSAGIEIGIPLVYSTSSFPYIYVLLATMNSPASLLYTVCSLATVVVRVASYIFLRWIPGHVSSK